MNCYCPTFDKELQRKHFLNDSPQCWQNVWSYLSQYCFGLFICQSFRNLKFSLITCKHLLPVSQGRAIAQDSHRGGLGSIPCPVMWNLWCTKWHPGFPCQSSFQKLIHANLPSSGTVTVGPVLPCIRSPPPLPKSGFKAEWLGAFATGSPQNRNGIHRFYWHICFSRNTSS
jgi:hypothetical protein